jgi:hypothetical protein
MKPVTGLTAFAGLAPPWPLVSLDANTSAVQAAVNDCNSYSNPFNDSSGAANTLTVTLPASLTATYTFGLLVYVKVANTTTATAVTLNVGSLGAKTVLQSDGSAPPVGALKANGVYPFFYDGTNFQLVGGVLAAPFQTGSFTATLTGFASAQTMLVKYQIIGNLVTLFFPGVEATSNASFFTFTNLPVALQPATTPKIVPSTADAFFNNGTQVTGTTSVALTSTPGVVAFNINGNQVGWASTGLKGIIAATNVLYTLD